MQVAVFEEITEISEKVRILRELAPQEGLEPST